MKSDLPKVLHPLLGKPLIMHVIDNIRSAGINDITVIIGYNGEMVMETVGDGVHYEWQREQLGTGHAVLQAEPYFKGYDGSVIVACGDAPLITGASFSSLLSDITAPDVKGVVLSMIQTEPKGYGRMIKDASGNLAAIVEEKDATDEQRKITEVNTGTYAFDSKMLFDGIKNIGNNNAQGEYYLPDVVEYINSKGFKTLTNVLAEPFEGSGINSPEELEKVAAYLRNKQ